MLVIMQHIVTCGSQLGADVMNNMYYLVLDPAVEPKMKKIENKNRKNKKSKQNTLPGCSKEMTWSSHGEVDWNLTVTKRNNSECSTAGSQMLGLK